MLLLRRDHQDTVLGARHECAIEPGQTLLPDLVEPLLEPLNLALGAQLKGDQGLGASSHAMTDVVARHDQILALVIPPANNDVSVGMPGVEVVDGHPVEPGVQVSLHLRHEVTNERFEIRKAGPLISGDHEPELVGVLLRPVQEGFTIDVIAVRIVKAPGGGLTGHPVADDVLEVCPCRAKVTANDARVAGLDDNASASGRDQPCGRAHAGTHAALGRGRRDVASLPQRAGTMLSCLPEDESGVAQRSSALRIPYASELGIELVLGHAAHLEAA